jgi:hypothetical protein
LKKTKYVSNESCVSCGRFGEGFTCYHHLISRGAGGVDEAFNMISTCLGCHNMYHQKGLVFMAEKFPSVKNWLLKHNWYLCELTGKWRHGSH